MHLREKYYIKLYWLDAKEKIANPVFTGFLTHNSILI